MKVGDLLTEILKNKTEYGSDFLDWDVYTEQLTPDDRKQKLESNWETVKDEDDWEYIKCVGFFTKFTKKKIFTINVNY